MAKLDDLYLDFCATQTSLDDFIRGVTDYSHGIVFSRCPETADDLAQEITIQVWSHLDNYDPARGCFSHFVRMTANSMLNRHLASKYADKEAIDSIQVPTADDSTTWETLTTNLDAREQELLRLLSIGHSFRDLETLYSCSRKSIRHRIQKIKKKIAAGAILSPSMSISR